MISSKQRSKLRSLAHHIKPSVYIGKSGLTDGVYASISESLDSQELIKVKFNENKELKKKLISDSESILSASVVGSIGNTVIIYKPNEELNQRKYKI